MTMFGSEKKKTDRGGISPELRYCGTRERCSSVQATKSHFVMFDSSMGGIGVLQYARGLDAG